MFNNTDPFAYAEDLFCSIRSIPAEGTASKRVVAALQGRDPRIQVKGFCGKVLDAIFIDGIEAYFSGPAYAHRLLERLERRYGRRKAREMLVNRCEVLSAWRHRDCKFTPDAYLIDAERRSVVCFEIEDYNPLNPYSIDKYGQAWFTLDAIYWDLHLIAYDVYGHPRVINFPESVVIARELMRSRRPREGVEE